MYPSPKQCRQCSVYKHMVAEAKRNHVLVDLYRDCSCPYAQEDEDMLSYESASSDSIYNIDYNFREVIKVF